MRKITQLPVMALGLIVISIYAGTLGFEWLEIEDGDYFFRNPLFSESPLWHRLIWAWTHSPEHNWIPATWSFCILLSEIFGMQAWAFRSASVLLHLGNGFLVYFLAKRFFPNRITHCCLGAVLFVSHPIQVESVVWISSIKGLLSTCGALLTLHCILAKRWILSWVLFALALLCKQDVVTLPVIVLLYGVTRQTRIDFWKLLPLVILSACGAFASHLVNRGNTHPETPESLFGLLERSFLALGHYVRTLILPLDLHPEYQIPVSFSPMNTIIAGITIIGLIMVIWKVYQGCKKNSLFSVKASSLQILAFLVALGPFVCPISSPLEFASDRLVYFPMVFLSLAFAGLVFKGKGVLSRIFKLGVGASMLLLSVSAHLQTQIWKDDRTLCESILETNSNHYLARINLAMIHARAKNFPTAQELLMKTVNQHPKRVRAWIELTKVAVMNRQLRQAHEFCQKGRELHPDDPHLAKLEKELRVLQ